MRKRERLERATMPTLFADLPIQALNWDRRAGKDDIARARSLSDLAACGGLRERDDLLSGAPALLSSVVNDVVSQSESRRLVLSGSGLINAPISNIRAARSIVEGQG